MKTIEQILAESRQSGTTWRELRERLMAREDEIADALRMAGLQLGGDIAFVNKAILDIGIGTTPDDEMVAHINQDFTDRVNYWTEIARRNGEGREGS